jgi:L-malate glycosyltransferase
MHKITTALKKKILIGIPCLLRGGTEMQTLLLVRALIELGYDVEICCYFEWDELVVCEFKMAGAKVWLLDWLRSIGMVAFIRALTKILRKTSPYIVHVQYMAPGFLPIVAAKLARVPVVLATVHQPGTAHGIVAHGLLRFGAMLTNRFSCVSEAAEKSWFGDSCLLNAASPEKIARRRHITIPNAVDIGGIDNALTARSPKVVETATLLEGKMVVGTVARMSREKGIDILLEAFALVHNSIPNAHLLIVGDGNQLIDLQGLGRHLNIGDAITWMGCLPWDEAIGCLGLMDVVVVPSRFEGFGLTAVEAMACGRLVVASKVDGLADVVKDGVTGVLVPPEDPLNLALVLIRLLKDKEYRQKIGNEARRHAEENYSYPTFRERCRVFYE